MRIEKPLAPQGKCRMEFRGTTTEEGRFGRPAIRWQFASDTHAASIVTGTYLAPGCSAHAVAQKIVDRVLAPGDDADITAMVGREYEISIAADGSTSILGLVDETAAT